MIQSHTLSLPRPSVDPDALGYFRFGPLGDRHVLTNEHGEWHLLDDDAFQHLLAGTLTDEHEAHPALQGKGFLRAGLDVEAAASMFRRRKKFVGLGPTHHHLALTGPRGTMTVEQIKAVVDHAMLSTAASLTFVVHATDVDLDLLGFLHQYCTEKNRYEGKTLRWLLHTPLASIHDEAATWLADHRFTVRFPFTGPQATPAQEQAASQLLAAGQVRRRAEQMLEAEVPLTAAGLDASALVATLKALGVARFRVVPQWRGEHALTPQAAASQWAALLDACLQAGDLVEASIAGAVEAATRTDATADPRLHSPALAELAYDAEGRILASPAAFDLDGDDFVLGTAGVASYKDVIHHPLRRALALASLVECLPGLHHHWAAPYIGLDPVSTWAATQDLFPRAPSQPEVAGALRLAELVLERLADPDVSKVEALHAWVR